MGRGQPVPLRHCPRQGDGRARHGRRHARDRPSRGQQPGVPCRQRHRRHRRQSRAVARRRAVAECRWTSSAPSVSAAMRRAVDEACGLASSIRRPASSTEMEHEAAQYRAGLAARGEAAAFLTDVWGLASAEVAAARIICVDRCIPIWSALEEGAEPFVRSTTFTCEQGRARRRPPARPATNDLPSTRLSPPIPAAARVSSWALPEGELFRFLANAEEVAPIPRASICRCNSPTSCSIRSMPRRPARSPNKCLAFASPTGPRAWCSCAATIATTALPLPAPASASLNHIAFKMQDIDAVMRGMGRLREQRAPAPS